MGDDTNDVMGNLVATVVASDELSNAKRCRDAGQHKESIMYYKQVLASTCLSHVQSTRSDSELWVSMKIPKLLQFSYCHVSY